MSIVQHDLWNLTFGRPWIDADELAAAVEQEVACAPLDHRTQLLIRDSVNALAKYWGIQRLEVWLKSSPVGDLLIAVWRSDVGPAGFPSLEKRVMQWLKPDTIRQFLRELGSRLPRPTRIVVGGSIALILSEALSRATEDVDVVDEVPAEIRSHHQLLDELAHRYGLRITHFQSHYLPKGWETRIRSLERFGAMDVDLIDTCDIFVGKLFSARTKDLDDLRILARSLDKKRIESRLRESGASLLSEATLSENAARNWYIVYGEPLPR